MAVCGHCWICGQKLDCGPTNHCGCRDGDASSEPAAHCWIGVVGADNERIICPSCVKLACDGTIGALLDLRELLARLR